jgi:hypothetical protein
MKLFLKIIGAIVAILILAFVALFAVFYFNPELGEEELTPEQTEINKIYNAVETQTGDINIESIDQINSVIVPIAKQWVVGTFPILAGRTPNSLSVLEKDPFILRVTEEYANSNMTDVDSLEISVAIERLDGVTFCPDADVYLRYPRGGLYALEYLHTAIHELLHALTCESPISTTFPAVWEEYFTDYFTMRVLSKHIGINTDIIAVSPEGVKIIRGLSRIIGEQELFNIYLTKDGVAFKRLVDSALGRGTYDALYADMEIIFRQSDYTYTDYTYIENGESGESGAASNPRVDEALQRIDARLNLGQLY